MQKEFIKNRNPNKVNEADWVKDMPPAKAKEYYYDGSDSLEGALIGFQDLALHLEKTGKKEAAKSAKKVIKEINDLFRRVKKELQDLSDFVG